MKTLSEIYSEHYYGAYNALDVDSKKIIDKYKADTKLSKSNELFARNFIMSLIERAENFFESQTAPKIEQKNGQIKPLENDEIVGI